MFCIIFPVKSRWTSTINFQWFIWSQNAAANVRSFSETDSSAAKIPRHKLSHVPHIEYILCSCPPASTDNGNRCCHTLMAKTNCCRCISGKHFDVVVYYIFFFGFRVPAMTLFSKMGSDSLPVHSDRVIQSSFDAG